jgi:Zn-dependent protease
LNLTPEFLALGLVWYVVFLFSTTCHEAGHALAAKLGGDPTAFHGGQVSLDPMPHIRREPFGMVFFPILSYISGGWMMGWASAPYDPYWARRYPRRAGWMALAGPGANFALVIIAAIVMRVGLALGAFKPANHFSFLNVVEPAATGLPEALAVFFSLLFSLNLLLGTFNLIPAPPLDGFAAVGLLMPENAARRWEEWGQSLGMFTIFGLIIAWRIYDFLYAPIFISAFQTLYAGVL